MAKDKGSKEKSGANGTAKAKGAAKRNISSDAGPIKLVPSSPRGFCGPPGPSRDAVLRHGFEGVAFEGLVIFNQDESLAGAASPKAVKAEGEPSALEKTTSCSTGVKKRG